MVAPSQVSSNKAFAVGLSTTSTKPSIGFPMHPEASVGVAVTTYWPALGKLLPSSRRTPSASILVSVMPVTVPVVPFGNSQVTSTAWEEALLTMSSASSPAQMVRLFNVHSISGMGLTSTSKSRALLQVVPSAQTEVWVIDPATSNSKDSHENDSDVEELGGTSLVQTNVSSGSNIDTLANDNSRLSPSQTRFSLIPPVTTRSMLLGMCTTWVVSADPTQVACSSKSL